VGEQERPFKVKIRGGAARYHRLQRQVHGGYVRGGSRSNVYVCLYVVCNNL